MFLERELSRFFFTMGCHLVLGTGHLINWLTTMMELYMNVIVSFQNLHIPKRYINHYTCISKLMVVEKPGFFTPMCASLLGEEIPVL